MDHLVSALLRAQNVYVIGRGAGLGAAQEVALKLKECCSLHAEAYSASEVLHGVMKPLTVLMLDTEDAATQDSMDRVEARFQEVGGEVYRLKPSDFDLPKLTPAASAAILIYQLYPIIREVAIALGYNPDQPETLAKVTVTV